MSYFLIGLLCGFVAAFPVVVVVIRLSNWWHRKFSQDPALDEEDTMNIEPPFV